MTTDEWVNKQALLLMQNCSTDLTQEYKAIDDARAALTEAVKCGKLAERARIRFKLESIRRAATVKHLSKLGCLNALEQVRELSEAAIADTLEDDEAPAMESDDG